MATMEKPGAVNPEAPNQPPKQEGCKICCCTGMPRVVCLITGLIVVAGIAFGAFYLGKKQTVTPTLPKQEEVVKPSPTPDETAGWKTYINDKYGFEFKYPNNWMYGEDNNLHNRNGINIYLRPEESKPTDPTYGEINIWVFNSTKTLNEFINSEMCNEPGGCNLSKDTEIVKLGGIDARKIKDKGGPLPSDTIVTKNNNVIVELDFNYSGESRENYSNLESKKIFDQILSTFRFD